MTTHTNILTQSRERILIARKYHRQGFIPCVKCEKPITEGQKITYKEATGNYTPSRHYHAKCFNSLYQ